MELFKEYYPGSIGQYLKDPLHRNTILLIASNAVSALLGFVFYVIIARLYSAEDVGLALSLISAMILLVVISRLGFDIGIVRLLPQGDNKRDIINSCFTIAGLFSIVLTVIFIAGLDLWSPDLLFVRGNAVYVVIFGLATLASIIFYLQEHAFIAFRATEYALIQTTVISALRIFAAVVLVGFGVMGIFSAWGLSVVITLALGNIFIRRFYPQYHPVPVIRGKVISEMLHFSFGNYIAEAFKEVPRWVLPLIIIRILTPETGAYFYSAWTVVNMLFMISYAANFSLLAQGAHQPELLRGEIKKAVRLILLLLVPAIIIVYFLGGYILLLFGAAYSQNAIDLLRLLAISSIPIAVITLYTTIKRIQMQLKPLIYVYGFVAVFTIAVSAVLMKPVGIVGIGIAWLASNGLVALVVWLTVYRAVRSGSVPNI